MRIRNSIQRAGYVGIGLLLGLAIAAHGTLAASRTSVPPAHLASPCGTSTPTHTGTKQRFAVDPTTGMSVQASHLHVDKSTNQFSQPKAGHEFLVVHLLFHNGSKKAQDYNPMMFNLHGSVSQENYNGDAMDTTITAIHSGKLAPGQFIAGDVAFEVPTTKQTYTLVWDADYGQNAPITVPLNA